MLFRSQRKPLTPPILVIAQGPQRPRTPHAQVLLFLARCQRSETAPTPLRTSVAQQAAANGLPSPGGKLCVGSRTTKVSALTGDTDLAFQSGVMRVWRESLHTVCRVRTWAF